MPWEKLLAAGAGGFVGATVRYGLSLALMGQTTTFPWVTLGVNILGCLLIGLLYPFVRERELLLPFLIPGVLGGFTTFSAFGHETYELAKGGKVGLAAAYVLASVLLGLGAVWVGRLAK